MGNEWLEIKEKRLRSDLTQEEVSEKLNIPTRYISEMENGKRKIDKQISEKLTALYIYT